MPQDLSFLASITCTLIIELIFCYWNGFSLGLKPQTSHLGCTGSPEGNPITGAAFQWNQHPRHVLAPRGSPRVRCDTGSSTSHFGISWLRRIAACYDSFVYKRPPKLYGIIGNADSEHKQWPSEKLVGERLSASRNLFFSGFGFMWMNQPTSTCVNFPPVVWWIRGVVWS